MHDCQATNERILDLAFGATVGKAQLSVLREVQECDACCAEYRSYQETLRACSRATSAAEPPEIYWDGYQNTLRQKLRALEVAPAPVPVVAWWRRLWEFSLPVPLPVAAMAGLVVACVAVWAAQRPATIIVVPAVAYETAPQVAPIAPSVESVQASALPTTAAPQVIVRERVVTRTVYLPRPARMETAIILPTAAARPALETPSEKSETTATATLAGFHTPGEVRLRVIKSDAQEEK